MKDHTMYKRNDEVMNIYNHLETDMDFAFFYNSKCIDMLKKWDTQEIDERHVFLHHENETLFANFYVYELATIRYKKLEKCGIRRPFDNCFLSLKYRDRDDVNKIDFKRFFDSARVKAEKYNRFIGTFAIELSDYLEDPNHPALDKLLDYVELTSKDIKFIFSVNGNNIKTVDKLYNKISYHIRRVERLSMEHIDANQYTFYAVSMLQNKGYIIAKDAEQLLNEYLVELSNKKSFAGFDSISDFVDDIIYALHGTIDVFEITESHLSEIKNEIMNDEIDDFSQRKIGFS